MCERTKIRNNIALKLEKELEIQVFTEPKEVSVADFPCIFVSTPQESISLSAQPDLMERELEINIQGFISGTELGNLADKMIRGIEGTLNKFEPTLSLKQVQTDMDTHGEHSICAFLLIYETSYEEKLWNP